MASLKEVKTRINSVKSTRKITSAMKMVASAKLHKAQGAIENMLPYQKKLNKILTNFLSADLPIESPYIRAREVKRVAIIAFSSNTSLCGAFNANVIKMLLQTVSEYRTLGQDDETAFKILHVVQWHITEQTMCTTIEDSNLLFHRHRTVLRLNQQLRILTPFVNCQCRYTWFAP